MKKKDFIPDFIQIPRQLLGDKDLEPLDRLLYGVIYWYGRLKDEKCTASNAAMARILMTSAATIANSLVRLEAGRYIVRFFTDETKKHRLEIVPTIAMGKISVPISVPKNRTFDSSVDESVTQKDDSSVDECDSSVDECDSSVDESHKFDKKIAENGELEPQNGGLSTKVDSSTDEQNNIIYRITKENNKKYYWTPPSEDVQTDSKKDSKKKTSKEPIGGKKQSTPPDAPPFTPPPPSGDFTSMVDAQKRFKELSDVPEQEVSDGIALFLNVFPGQFLTGKPFAVPANRKAVKKILMRLSLPELKNVVDRYISKKGDPFRPEVATIASFCNFKFDRIEAFVKKSAGNLWAHRPTGTPEQEAVRDKQYAEKIARDREVVRKAKEDWEREHPQQ